MAALPLISAAAVAGAAGAAYLNAKLSLGADIEKLSYDREWKARLDERIRGFGERCTLYQVFDGVELEREALWFEGRSWTYGELKMGELFFKFILEVLMGFLGRGFWLGEFDLRVLLIEKRGCKISALSGWKRNKG